MGTIDLMVRRKLYIRLLKCKVKYRVLQTLLHLLNPKGKYMNKVEERELPRPANLPPPPIPKK
jgi:hypothetical protein